jgi:hypothetical protein
MKKTMLFLFLSCLLVFLHQAFADDVSDKTDGSFVGDNPPQPINSTFVGDETRSVDDNTFEGQDDKKQTDSGFVGENAIADQNREFYGSDFDKQTKDGKDAAFAGDGAFIGNNYGQ